MLQGRLAALNILALTAAAGGAEPAALQAWEYHGGYEFISGSAMLVRALLGGCAAGANGLTIAVLTYGVKFNSALLLAAHRFLGQTHHNSGLHVSKHRCLAAVQKFNRRQDGHGIMQGSLV